MLEFYEMPAPCFLEPRRRQILRELWQSSFVDMPSVQRASFLRAKFCGHCGTSIQPSPVFDGKARGGGSRLSILQQSAPSTLQEKIRAASSQVEGERKPVTILFTDIVGSTTLAEKLDPEEWKEIVNGAHQRVSAAVYRYEGTIAQLLGDGLMAVFGAPLQYDDHSEHAVRAAIQMIELIDQYDKERESLKRAPIRIGIGIASGQVIAGYTGTQQRATYTCVGDTVNLAARLESHTKVVGKPILVDEPPRQALSAEIAVEDEGLTQLKGKMQSVRVFSVKMPMTL